MAKIILKCPCCGNMNSTTFDYATLETKNEDGMEIKIKICRNCGNISTKNCPIGDNISFKNGEQ